MEETTIREPEQIRQQCAKKLLRVVRGPELRAILGYFLNEEWTVPTIANLRLAFDGCVVALVGGDRVHVTCRHALIHTVHSISRKAALDGDELGYFLAQVAKIKREALQ
jgi:hypothetical protein